MKNKLVFCLSLCVLLAGTQAQAVDGKNRYLILGPGAAYCADIITNLKEGAERKDQAAVIIYSNWLGGYLTAYNRDAKGTYSILGDMTFNQVFAWTISYCKDHPGHLYSSAVDAFVHEYHDDRYTSMPGAKVKPKARDDEDDDDNSDN
jgi:hypothetical protein